jgi:pimeloyl-ACP methyl ester carboxylesterase
MHMTRPYSFARFGILVAVSALTAVATAAAAPPQNAQTSPPRVVLIHGAWADGSSWSKVITRLVDQGLDVVAVQLPLTSLADDVATVQRAIAREPGPVLLVAHSYGGVVMTEAGNDPKVVGLVYVAAFAPKSGESAFALANANPTPILQQVVLDASGFLTITPAGIRESFAQDLSADEQTVLTAAQKPTAAEGSLSAPVTTPAWRTKPTWFAIATEDRVVSPALQAVEAAEMKATTIKVPASHVAMLSQPEAVAALICDAAKGAR